MPEVRLGFSLGVPPSLQIDGVLRWERLSWCQRHAKASPPPPNFAKFEGDHEATFWAPLCKISSWLQTCLSLSPLPCFSVCDELQGHANPDALNTKQCGVIRWCHQAILLMQEAVHPPGFESVSIHTNGHYTINQKYVWGSQCYNKALTTTQQAGCSTCTLEGYKPLHALTLPLQPCPGAGSTRVQASRSSWDLPLISKANPPPTFAKSLIQSRFTTNIC